MPEIELTTLIMPTKKQTDEVIETKCAMIVNELKELRESKGITTAKLHQMTGIAQPNITRMEVSGGIPNLKTIITIAEALGAEIQLVVNKK